MMMMRAEFKQGGFDGTFFRLRGRLLNTFCVKLNMPEESKQVEENCQTIGNFSSPLTETAQQVEKKFTLIIHSKLKRC